MKAKRKALLPFIVALLAFCYGVLDYTGTMDNLRGRKAATDVHYRLSAVESGDSVIMFNDEPSFEKGIEFLVDHTRNRRVKELKIQGIVPTAIARLGSVERPPNVGEMPQWDSTIKFYAPPSSPLIVAYEYTRNDRHSGYGLSLCTLGEIVHWVNESREQERFVVYIVLVGLLSVVIAFRDLTTKEK